MFVLLMTCLGGLLLLINHVLNTGISPDELKFTTPGYVIDKAKKVTFHIIPKEPKLLNIWIVTIDRDIGPLFKITHHTKICSRHFQDSDFRITYCGSKFLKPDSIPSVFANRGSTSRWKESHQK